MPTRLATTLAAIAILLALALPGPAAADTPAANSLGPDMFGISVGGALQNEDSTTLGRDLDALQAAGSRWVRADINWAQVQAGGPSSYDWASIDRVVQGATDRGMKVLGLIVYTPSWARPSGTSATYGPDPTKYAAFATTAVRHYAAMGVHAYEVWNEPNISAFWTPAPNPAAYTQLLQAAYPAIKGADPEATVLTGGTAPAPSDGTNYSPVDFLKRIYANGGGGSFDAVSHHPYCWPADPGDAQSWSAWYQMFGASPSLRSVMIANGDEAKKIWATEFGAPTNGPSGSHVSEGTQAQVIAKAYSLWKTYDWGGPLFTYQGRDFGTSTSTRENFFGLLRNDFSEKPAFAAYQAAANSTTDTGGTDDPSATTITVKGRDHGKGGGSVKGRVSTQIPPGEARSVVAAGRVGLRLYRKGHDRWRTASHFRTTGITADGRFHRGLRSLRHRKVHPGTYRVRARYGGTAITKPANSRSPKFKLRP